MSPRLQDFFQVEKDLLEPPTAQIHGATNYRAWQQRAVTAGTLFKWECPGKGKIQEWSFPVWENREFHDWRAWQLLWGSNLKLMVGLEKLEGRTYSFPPLTRRAIRETYPSWLGHTTPVENCEVTSDQLKSTLLLSWTSDTATPPFLCSFIRSQSFLDYQKDIMRSKV